MASLSALIVSTCSISFLSSCTAGLEAEDDEAAPTLGMAAVNSACERKEFISILSTVTPDKTSSVSALADTDELDMNWILGLLLLPLDTL